MKVLVCAILLMLAAPGCLYSKIQRPLDTDFTSTDLGGREGRASNTSALWLFAWGDAGTKAAADNGGIRVIKHADREFFVLLFGLYARETTVVYGD
jgi:hypothetical protein